MRRLTTPAAQALADLGPLLADATRLGKGRTYYRRGGVQSLEVEPGAVEAEVVGSRPVPYEVTISTRAAPAHVAEDLATEGWVAAVPPPRDVAFDCTCPDWGDPCKHAVAVLYALAEAVDTQPELLGRWRSVGTVEHVASPAESTNVIELGDALASLISRSNDPALRRSAASVLAALKAGAEGTGEGAASTGGTEVDDALGAFFSGGVPASGPILGDQVELAPLSNPYLRLAITIEGVDAAPVLADALLVITDQYGRL